MLKDKYSAATTKFQGLQKSWTDACDILDIGNMIKKNEHFNYANHQQKIKINHEWTLQPCESPTERLK